MESTSNKTQLSLSKTAHNLYKSEIHYSVRRSPELVSALSQTNLLQTPQPSFVGRVLILCSCLNLDLPSNSFPSVFAAKNFVSTSYYSRCRLSDREANSSPQLGENTKLGPAGCSYRCFPFTNETLTLVMQLSREKSAWPDVVEHPGRVCNCASFTGSFAFEYILLHFRCISSLNHSVSTSISSNFNLQI
jgi:hypothetical protein